MSGKLSELLNALKVRRWHTEGRLEQDLHEHCARMFMIIETFHPNPSKNLLRAVMLHDLHEAVFADMPYGTKTYEIQQIEKQYQQAFWDDNDIDYPTLTVEEEIWLKFADRYEAYLFLNEQLYLTDRQNDKLAEAFELSQGYATMLSEFGYEVEV